MKRLLVLTAALVALAACSDSDNDARADLPAANQMNDISTATIVVMPDGYPNTTHKCVTVGGTAIGFWTTTDRTLILIYNDHACPEANLEADMTVINGVPRAIVNASGG